MTYVSNIVAEFGGVRPMARAIGKPTSTVQSWKDRGSIPDPEKPIVLAVANQKGLRISKDDFWPVPKSATA